MTEIKQIINGIKDITEDGATPINIINFGEVMKSNFYFHNPISKKDLNSLSQKKLPEEYLNFLEISNGAILFDNEFKGVPLGAACKIYSSSDLKITDSIQKVPILLLQDIGEIFIDINRYKKNMEYLSYPGIEADKYFSLSFCDWLEKYIVSSGNEFWNW